MYVEADVYCSICLVFFFPPEAELTTHMDTLRSAFSRAKKGRLESGYKSLSYRQKYVLHHLSFLYPHVKPRKTGPRCSTGKKARGKTNRGKSVKVSSETDNDNLSDHSVITTTGMQTAGEETGKEKAQQASTSAEPTDDTMLEEDPITAEIESGAASVGVGQGQTEEDDDPLDQDPITSLLEEVRTAICPKTYVVLLHSSSANNYVDYPMNQHMSPVCRYKPKREYEVLQIEFNLH